MLNGNGFRPLVPVLASLSLLLCGCQSLSTFSVSAAAPEVHGNVHGGQQPVAGVTLQLYAVNTTQDGGPGTPLLNPAPTSAANGDFSFGKYTCPSPDALVYLTAAGGNPGLPPGTNNRQSVLVSALGACGNLNSNTYISINEVTTVASLFPLAAFANGYTNIGASPAHAPALAAQFAEITTLVNSATGITPGPAAPAGLAIPSAEINSLADVISACTNSVGGVAGDGSPCGTLFALATPAGGTAPTNIADALLAIFLNPTQNAQSIFNLTPAAGPFQPTLTTAPAAWSIFPTPVVAATPSLIGQYLLTEGTGSIAHDSSGKGNDATIVGATWDGTADLSFFGASKQYMQLPTALNAARSFQFALYEPPLSFAQLPLAPGYGDGATLQANMSILCGTDTQHVCFVPGLPSTTSRFQATTDGTEASVPLTPGWHILSFLCGENVGGILSKTHILYDGVEVPGYLSQGDANTCPVTATGHYQVGGSSAYYQTYWFGKVAAVWAWNTELTVAQASASAAAGRAYMFSKGIPTQYANANNSTPLILAGFDSRTEGQPHTPMAQTWPEVMTLNQPMTSLNISSAGSTAFDWCYQYSLTYGQQIPANPTGPVITIIWGGFNDAIYGSQTTAQIASSLQCIVQAAKAKGSLVVLATETSAMGTSDPRGDAYKDAITPVIRANAFSWGVDDIADLASDPVLGADLASTNTAIFVDHTHPSIAGHLHISGLMSNIVNELTGSTAAAPHLTASGTYQELAGDRFLTLNATAPQTVTLPSCIGYSLPRTITNAGTGTASLLTLNGEVLTGSASVAAGATALITPTPGPVTTSGCSWVRTQ